MNDKLKEQFKKRDRTVRVLSKDGNFRVVAITSTNLTRTAQKRHNLSYVPAFFLARTLTASSMMASFLKGEERIIVELQSDKVIKRVFSESMRVGETRGFINYDEKFDISNLDNLTDLLVPGLLVVTRILYNKAEPVKSVIPIQQGDVSTDLAQYFAQSEQIPTAVLLDVSMDDKGNIMKSAGILLQAMPGANPKDIKKAAQSLEEIEDLSHKLDKGFEIEKELIDILPFEFDVIHSVPVDFYCRCSKEKFIDKLITFDFEEIESLKKENQRELVCQYCNEKYYLEDADFDYMLETIKARSN